MELGPFRQSTAGQVRIIGVFISDSDGKSPNTGLSIANTDVRFIKNGGVAVSKNSGGGTHIKNGEYAFTFDATDTDTVGELDVSILVAGAYLVREKYIVLEEAVYDEFYYALTERTPLLVSMGIASVRPVLGIGIQPIGTISLD